MALSLVKGILKNKKLLTDSEINLKKIKTLRQSCKNAI